MPAGIAADRLGELEPLIPGISMSPTMTSKSSPASHRVSASSALCTVVT